MVFHIMDLQPIPDEAPGERTGPFARILDAQAKERVNGVCERCIRPTQNRTFLDLRHNGWFLSGRILCGMCQILTRHS